MDPDFITTDTENTEAEATAVDEGVQEELPKDARYHRRAARKLLIGVPGLNDFEKLERVVKARNNLNEAIALMEATTGVTEEEVTA